MQAEGFREVRILDNFYQTSSFFPMPVILIGTRSESGLMNLGPYSLCFPYTVAGARCQMILTSRANSNTAVNLRRTGLCSLNFIPDDRRYMRNCVMLGYPGETTEEKMKHSIFRLVPSQRGEGQDEERRPEAAYPDLVAEALQVFECSLESFTVDEATQAMRSILNVEKVLLRPRWHRVLMEGRRKFPNLPVDYGFRNNAHFWFSRHSPPYREPIPRSKAASVDSVLWAITRGGFAADLEWPVEAAERLVAVPRVFLHLVLKGIAEEARRAGIRTVTPEFLEEVRDKRGKDKGK
jgi:flavin reductase (DIM6/NTAB) family NADH-FMN oxidoreductase RutF